MVNVLCARVRMEEKRLIEALAAAGLPARQLPPVLAPVPVGPNPPGPFAVTASGAAGVVSPGIVVDRCADRPLAGVIVPALRGMGAAVVDAGLAAKENRLTLATLLANAGIPRPATFLVTSDVSGLTAARDLGYPATLLPLEPGASEIPLHDRDIAEAVFEHRQVLGRTATTLALVQAGAFDGSQRLELLVVAGRVAATSLTSTVDMAAALRLAELAAAACEASILGVSVVMTADGPVVWDLQAVPEFRGMAAIDGRSTVAAIVELIASIEESPTLLSPLGAGIGASARREAAGGVVLSA